MNKMGSDGDASKRGGWRGEVGRSQLLSSLKLSLSILVFLFVTAIVADTINGQGLLPWVAGRFGDPEGKNLVWRWAFTLAFAGGFWFLVHSAAKHRSVGVELEKVKASRKAMIALVSSQSAQRGWFLKNQAGVWQFSTRDPDSKRETLVDVPSDATVRSLVDLARPDRASDTDAPVASRENVDDALVSVLENHPWMQVLRGIHAHEGTLERVVLIGSAETAGRPGSGSGAQLGVLRDLLVDLLDRAGSTVEVEFVDPAGGRDDKAFRRGVFSPTGVDFDSVKQVADLVDSAIKDLVDNAGLKERDVVVDCTGGLKTASIGAAIATLDYSSGFQYVSGDGEVSAYHLRVDLLRMLREVI